jgi:hypothetical protein
MKRVIAASFWAALGGLFFGVASVFEDPFLYGSGFCFTMLCVLTAMEREDQ